MPLAFSESQNPHKGFSGVFAEELPSILWMENIYVIFLFMVLLD